MHNTANIKKSKSMKLSFCVFLILVKRPVTYLRWVHTKFVKFVKKGEMRPKYVSYIPYYNEFITPTTFV